jgi:hypothetical protein
VTFLSTPLDERGQLLQSVIGLLGRKRTQICHDMGIPNHTVRRVRSVDPAPHSPISAHEPDIVVEPTSTCCGPRDRMRS